MRWSKKSKRKAKVGGRTSLRLLEGRVVYCLNCETQRPLTVNSSGQVVCSACAGNSWQHASVPLASQFWDYDEKVARREVESDKVLREFGRHFPLM